MENMTNTDILKEKYRIIQEQQKLQLQFEKLKDLQFKRSKSIFKKGDIVVSKDYYTFGRIYDSYVEDYQRPHKQVLKVILFGNFVSGSITTKGKVYQNQIIKLNITEKSYKDLVKIYVSNRKQLLKYRNECRNIEKRMKLIIKNLENIVV